MSRFGSEYQPPPSEKELLGFCIVEGLPDHVMKQVNWLISEGWDLHGDLLPVTHDKKHLVAQGMKKYRK